MEILVSAVLGEAITRSIKFFISKCSKPEIKDVEEHLCRVLLRAQIIVDEAIGRDIRNQTMHKQLNMLRDSMYRGYYKLDSFRCQYHGKEEAKDQIVSQYSLFSKVTSLEHFNLSCGTSTKILEELQEVLDSLSSMLIDANELVKFFMSYPRLYRQPYSMHLLVSNCMFGRQMEAELVINFLLHTETPCAEELEVLPIVGPGRVGKSTLVAHVCKDERVRDHFSEILFVHNHDLRDDELATFREGYAMKHQNYISDKNKDGRLLVVVELVGDINEHAWNRLYSHSRLTMQIGSKIIVTSQSDKIVKFGTTQALTLKYLSDEAFWYFFKTLTFGSMDPEAHPRLKNLAMEIVNKLKSSFIAANTTAHVLRNNFDARFWCKVLVYLKGYFEKHVSIFGDHPVHLMNQCRPTHFERLLLPSDDFVIYSRCECSSQEKVPKIKMEDLLYGDIKHAGKFEVLGWSSRIPPYHSHVYTCEILELKPKTSKRKRRL